MSTESTAFDAVDTGSAVESQEAKNEDDNISGLEGDNNKADNDVDEGVDLQGRAHFFMYTLKCRLTKLTTKSVKVKRSVSKRSAVFGLIPMFL